MLRSAIIPGWGQWYNGKKLKAVLVLGAELALAGNAIYFNQMAVRTNDDYEKEYYRENRRLYLWWLAAAHLLNVMDAVVDAHLWGFDTGPDLSGTAWLGISFSLNRCGRGGCVGSVGHEFSATSLIRARSRESM